ncbi:hypothetical protein ACOME3_008217 [Neoechinorhynchus agilis]
MEQNSQPIVDISDLHLSATDIQIKTWSVQQILAPLILQVTDLMDRGTDSPGSSSSRSICLNGHIDLGRSRSAKRLLGDLTKAIDQLCNRASSIFQEVEREYSLNIGNDAHSISLRKAFNVALQAVRETGSQLVLVSKSFVSDPQDSIKRQQVAGAARPLLFAVARLLTVVDTLDIDVLSRDIQEASSYVMKVGGSGVGILKDNNVFDNLVEQVYEICDRAAARQTELINDIDKDRLALLRYRVTKQLKLINRARDLVITCKGDKAVTKLHSNYVRALVSSLNTMSTALMKSEVSSEIDDDSLPILSLIEHFQASLDSINSRQFLEGSLERIIRRVGLLADEQWVDKMSRRDLVAVCNDARQSLQDFLNGKHECVQIEKVCDRVKSLLRQLLCSRNSDLWLNRTTLINDAKMTGSTKELKALFYGFIDLADSAARVFDSRQSQHQRYAQLAAEDLSVFYEHALKPAIDLVSVRKKCQKSYNIMLDCIELCDRLLQVIQDCIDDGMPLENILRVVERKINQQLDKLRMESDPIQIKASALDIDKMCQHLIECIQNELNDEHEYPSVLQSLVNNVLPDFVTQSTKIPFEPIEFSQSCDHMHSAVQQLCKWSSNLTKNESSGVGLNLRAGEHVNISRDVMRKLPQSEIEQIERHCEILHRQKRVFDKEVLKWDERGNDIVLLAKKMCLIMMDMSDFTRGKGPLRTTMDVINAAKQISQFGNRLDRLARNVALECVESQSKQDLLAYLDRISLFTHQLSITSRVKADVQNISGELVVSGLDSATSLIMSAKNLMNSVILVVKASYIASTKYPRRTTETRSLQSDNETLGPLNADSAVDISKIRWNVVK